MSHWVLLLMSRVMLLVVELTMSSWGDGKYGIMLVQDLIVNSLWLMSLVTAGSDLSLTLGYSLGTHCSIVRYDCFEFLRYACSATLPSHCIHYITLGLHCIPWIVLAFYPFILSPPAAGPGVRHIWYAHLVMSVCHYGVVKDALVVHFMPIIFAEMQTVRHASETG